MVDASLRPARQLKAEGWTPRQFRQGLADGSLIRLTRGVYAAAVEHETPAQLHLRRAAALLSMHREEVVVSHASAAIAHGLAVQVSNPGRIHVTVPPPGRGRRRSGYHVHQAPLDAGEIVTLDGLRVTSLARTLVDLARTTPYAWGVIAADQVLRRSMSREALRAALDAGGVRRGVEQARRAIDFADPRSQSPAESASRVIMARAGLPVPELQFQVIGPDGWVATSDFAWPEHRLVGEMDGKSKYSTGLRPGQTPEDAVLDDLRRQEAIRQAGFWITRWGWAEAWDVRALGELVRGGLVQASGLVREVA